MLKLKKITTLFIMLGFLFISAESSAETRQFTGNSFLLDSTPITITIIADSADEKNVTRAIDEVITKIKTSDSMLFASGGLADRINSLPKGESIKLPFDILSMIKKGIKVSALTHNFYDIAAPSPKSFFTKRDWRRIEINDEQGTLSFKSDKMKLDLTRISKGYYVDTGLTYLKNNGYMNNMITAGSIQKSSGHDIHTPWAIQVDFEMNDQSKFAHRAKRYNISDIAAATVNRNGLGKDLIDGRSKDAADPRGIESVTILTDDGVKSVAYALAVYSIGQKYAINYANDNPQIAAIMVNEDGQIFASEGLGNSKKLTSRWASETKYGGPNDVRQKKLEEEKEIN